MQLEPIFQHFCGMCPSPHITFKDGRSVPPPPLSYFVYGPVNDSAIGIWLIITLELILTEEPILVYHALRPMLTVDKIRLYSGFWGIQR